MVRILIVFTVKECHSGNKILIGDTYAKSRKSGKKLAGYVNNTLINSLFEHGNSQSLKQNIKHTRFLEHIEEIAQSLLL